VPSEHGPRVLAKAAAAVANGKDVLQLAALNSRLRAQVRLRKRLQADDLWHGGVEAARGSGHHALRVSQALGLDGAANVAPRSKFTIDNMHTPIKILTTSSSVNPIQKSVYTDAVSHWEAVLAQEGTMYARKRLEKVRAEYERNQKQQCVRVRIVLEHNGQVMTAISDPFMSVANLTKEKQKEAVKKEKADGAKRQRT
jgi:S-adenosylmethionine hydrolase